MSRSDDTVESALLEGIHEYLQTKYTLTPNPFTV